MTTETTEITASAPAPEETPEQESQWFLQSTLDALASHIVVLDHTGKIIAANKAWRQFSEENEGTANSCGVGANYIEVCDAARGIWAEEAPAVAHGIRQVMAGRQQVFCLEYPCPSHTEQRWFTVCVTRFDGGRPMRVVVAHENITARKRAEQELRDSEARKSAILETALDCIIGIDAQSRILEWNPASENQFAKSLHPPVNERVEPPKPRERG